MIGRVIAAGLLLGVAAVQSAPAAEMLAVPVEYGDKTIELPAYYYRPEGPGPFPAVVLMHGCSGISPSHHAWARWLNERGYAVLIADSFNPRGTRQVCTPRPQVAVAPMQRAGDARAAARVLAERPEIDGSRLALMGFSHGGASTLFASLSEEGKERAPQPFLAAIAFYPDCSLRGRVTQSFAASTPVLILIGEADDWTPAQRCRDLMPRIDAAGAPVTLKTYPDAYHGYDVVGSKLRFRPDVANRNKPGGCCGAMLGFNEPAFLDSQIQVEQFLARYLGVPR